MPLRDEDLATLTEAKRLLENPGLPAKLSNLVGKPIEKGFDLLPVRWREQVATTTHDALNVALKLALSSMDARTTRSWPVWHKVAATVSGAAGGAFGLPALAIELPISTTILCRSIADIARANGEDLSQPAAKLACIEVFALGGPTASDDASETAYFAIRAALARAVSEAAEHVAAKTIANEGAPALVRLVALVAARFKLQVSQKAAATAIPLLGAAGGAAINYMFIDHFQDMSRGHFAVRRLERIYGADAVRAAYEAIDLKSVMDARG